jgi:hypothetical protein
MTHALGSFQAFHIFQIWDEPDVLERFQNQVWKLHLLPKETTYTLDFRKYLIRVFLVLLEDSLKIFSETLRAGKKPSTES